MKEEMKNLIFVDCEGHGVAPTLNNSEKFECGAVEYNSRATLHIVGANKKNFEKFEAWLVNVCNGRPIFVSDNPAYDFQFVNYYFHYFLGHNPFGHSARRISDFYAGLVGDFSRTQKWKHLRISPHDHNPVNDAMGNAEAFQRLINGER